jgi:streptogramin lyase
LAGVRFRFKIPHRARGPKARFLSPGTASLQVTAYNAAHTSQLARLTQNTTPGGAGCTPVSNGSFSCAFVLHVPPGDDTFDVTAFDGLNATGAQLSAATDFPFAVVAGGANGIAMTLGGIPATLSVALVGSPAYATGSQVSGFRIGGVGRGAAQQFQITAKDADGNTIVAPGAPALTLTSTSPKISIAPVAGLPGRFTVTPLAETNALAVPDPNTAILLDATAAPVGTGTNFVSATLSLQNDPIAFVGNYETLNTPGNTGVQAYAPWSASPVLSIPNGTYAYYPAMALDAAGNLYVTNYNSGTVIVYAPESTTPARSILSLSYPYYGMALDTAGDIFVSEGGSEVQEFTPASGGFPSRTLTATSSPTGILNPYNVAVDATGNLYVSNFAGTIGVAVFAPGSSTTPTMTFHNGMGAPNNLVFDASGNLYVSNNSGLNVTEYKPPFSAYASNPAVAPFATFGSNGIFASPQGVAVDHSNNVYVADSSSSAVFEFSPSAPATAVRSLAANGPYNVAIDSLGYVYIPGYGGLTGPLAVYPPGTSTTATSSLTTGLYYPYGVVVWP